MTTDWRLQGQEDYLRGVTLIHQFYRLYEKNPQWDHDHCEFCWAKFALTNDLDTLQQEYSTEEEYRWICEKCFEDFKEMFEWNVIEKLNL